MRAPADNTVEVVEAQLKHDLDLLARGVDVGGLLEGSTPGLLPLSVDWRTDSVSAATKFHPDCIQAVRDAAGSVLDGDELVEDVSSGAGHDSVYASKRCPTTMVFVPCRGGVSHNPEEYTSPEDCAIGAEVLCQAVVRYDRMRTD